MSFNLLKNKGISISRKIKQKSKNYIAYKTQMAIHRGLKKVDKQVKNYIKKEYPETAKGLKRYI